MNAAPRPPFPSILKNDIAFACLAGAAYYACVSIGMLFVSPQVGMATIWPASGILLGSLLISPRRRWPPVLAAVFVVTVLGNLLSGSSFAVSTGFGLANCLEGLLAAGLMTKFHGEQPRLNTFERSLGFLLLCVTAGNAITACLGALVAGRAFGAPFPDAWLMWFAADGAGMILLAPAVIILHAAARDRRATSRKVAASARDLILPLYLVATIVIFSMPDEAELHIQPYVLLPFTILAALLLRPVVLTLANIAASGMVILFLLRGSGPFINSGHTELDHVFHAQVFIMIQAAISLLAAAALHERRESERTALGGESRFRALFESSPVAMWEEDFSAVRERFDQLRAAGVGDLRSHLEADPGEVLHLASLVRVLNINQRSVELLRARSAEEVIRDLPSYFGEEGRAVFRNELVAIWNGDQVFESELPIRLPRGDEILLSLRLVVQPGSERTLSRVVASFIDVTERKRAEQALRKERDRTLVLAEMYARTMEFIRSDDYRDKDREMFAFALDAAVKLTDSKIGFFHVVDSNQADVILTTWNAEALKHCTASYDTHYPLDKAGSWVDCVRFRKPVVYNDFENTPNRKGLPPGHNPIRRFMSIPVIEGGRVIHIFGVGNKAEPYTDTDLANMQLVANELHKIEVRKRAERERALSEERFKRTFENAPVMMTLSRLSEGTFIDVNRKFCEVSGYSRDEAIGRTSIELGWITAGDRALLVRDLRERKRVAGRDLTFTARDGSTVLARYYGELLDMGGQKVLLSIVQDVTDQKRLEEQYRQAQKMEAIGTLAGGVAHDFNNILTAMSGYAHLLDMDGRLSDKDAGYVHEIINSIDRAANLTRSLLAFSRKQEMDVRLANLNDIVFGMKKILQRVIGEDIEFSVNLSMEDLMVVVDRGHIEQVLMNLVVNARDAMPDGGKLLIGTRTEVIAEREVIHAGSGQHRKFCVVTVEDTGNGIPAELIDRIFEPFFTTKEVGKGTGLGLSMVYGIIKKHGGHITARSEPGKGTTFTVLLPLAAAEAVERSDEEMQAVPGGTETVLVVEDAAEVRELIQRVLTTYGYTVLIAANGDDGCDLYDRHADQISLVITDVIMPRRNGIEVYEHVRAAGHGTAVLFMSGYTGEKLALKGLSLGVINFVPKPVMPGDLLRAVRTLLDGRALNEAAAAARAGEENSPLPIRPMGVQWPPTRPVRGAAMPQEHPDA